MRSVITGRPEEDRIGPPSTDVKIHLNISRSLKSFTALKGSKQFARHKFENFSKSKKTIITGEYLLFDHFCIVFGIYGKVFIKSI